MPPDNRFRLYDREGVQTSTLSVRTSEFDPNRALTVSFCLNHPYEVGLHEHRDRGAAAGFRRRQKGETYDGAHKAVFVNRRNLRCFH